MKLFPTQTAFHLAAASGAMVTVGLIAGHPAVVAWGAASLVGVAIARAATLVSVARIRAAGFEMLWSTQQRSVRVQRGGEVTIEAEVRNRDTLAARYVGLRVIASSQLDVSLEPSEGEVPASGKLKVTVRVRAPRVGHHGIFGLALEVRGAPGLFEVPLTFANPFGIDVRPASFASSLGTAVGGRTRLSAEGGRAGRTPGEGSDLRELREYQPGDPFKRIAFRASARRGKLMVRDMEHEERDLVWVVLDASVEHWAGPSGKAPLDVLIDEAASIVDRHIRRGDKVGLLIAAGRMLATIDPGRGPAHGAKLHEALATATACHDHDRSDIDEAEVANRVLEHLRPLEPSALELSRRDLDRLASRAIQAMGRAPFRLHAPTGVSVRERRLRQYLAVFGIEAQPRSEPELLRTLEVIAQSLKRLSEARPRPSIVHVAAALPLAPPQPLVDAIKHLSRGTEVHWVFPRFDEAIRGVVDGRPESKLLVDAALGRLHFEQERVARLLRRLGVKLSRKRAVRRLDPTEASP